MTMHSSVAQEAVKGDTKRQPESNRNEENNKLLLSQIGDIAGRGNFILAFPQRPEIRK